MRLMIKTTILAAVSAVMFAAAPALAQKAKRQAPLPAPVFYYEVDAYASDPYVVTDGARYIGRDPDIRIRHEILKDDTAHNGNAY